MPTPKTVYIVRHGQSEDNAAPVFQAYDSPLSEKGLSQAAAIAARVKHLSFDALIASPQLRAQQTAQAIADMSNKQVETSDYFVERIKPSALDGKPWADEDATALWREWESSIVIPDTKAQDGENFSEIVDRADRALDYLQNRDEDTIVVVSHGHFIRTLIARVLVGDELDGKLLKRFYELTSLENTAITVLKYRDGFEEDYRWRLWTLNDHAHFAE